jgi:SpoVK/Ycf46/Vps4 family AAA+-type ATPase
VYSIFSHARKCAPCILVLEDLDTMLSSDVKSVLLNELDGLAPNDGILTIATTNHPEEIDEAILKRPSRFDVKYTYSSPDLKMREHFARKWLEKNLKELPTWVRENLDTETISKAVAEKTNGFSYAYMKEL